MITLPDNVTKIMNLLQRAGYEAFVVGGCVRDSIMGRVPNDWDICTNATPEEMKVCFQGLRVAETGMKHGTLTVLLSHQPYEVTTYRIDGEYTDGRHPDQVRFTSSIQDDLSRRDFTVNAMAYNPACGLLDPFGGAEDLDKRVIRCVGKASLRFEEDALRIMRGIRFASQLSFTIDEETKQALTACRQLLSRVSAERIRVEFDKLLCGPGAREVLSNHREIIAQIIPEVIPMFDLDQQNHYHSYTVWDHTLHAVGHIKSTPVLRLCAFFHDIGKPGKMTVDNGFGHFYKHEILSEEIANQVMQRLKYDNRTRETVTAVVRNHSIVFRPSVKQARKLLYKLGEERLRLLIELEYADVKSQNPIYVEERVENIRAFEETVNEVLEAEQCFSLRDLEISGADLLNYGLPQGPEIGRILKMLLEMVLEGELPNEKEHLMEAVARLR